MHAVERPADDTIQLVTEAIDLCATLKLVSDTRAGAIDFFLGTTRQEIHREFGVLQRLDYAAFNEMAEIEIQKIIAAARDQWNILRVAVIHRLGECPVGEASVLIAVSTPHRNDAFEACRFIIDQLKLTVPIWKKDVYARAGQWQHPAERE